MEAKIEEEGKVKEDANVETGDISESQLRDGGLNIAIAWFVGPETYYTSDQFDWAVESLLRDNEGDWWARASTTPRDSSLETEQIYINQPAGMSMFGPIGRETEIDSSIDGRFPEVIRDKL